MPSVRLKSDVGAQDSAVRDLSSDPADALSGLDRVVSQMLEESGFELTDPVAGDGADGEIVAGYVSAHDIVEATVLDPGELSLSDVAVAIDGYRGWSSTSSRVASPKSPDRRGYAPLLMDAPPYSAAAVDVLRLPAGTTEPDRVAVEEPLEIRIAGRPVAVTMRTPGHDEELALGFCLSEGLRPRDARLPDDLAANTVEVDAPGFDPAGLQRSFYTSSSCGVCGKGALEAVEVDAPRVDAKLRAPFSLVASLPDRLREAQAGFAATGGLHATGLFSAAGEPLCVREDVGRHNAMDKVIGWAFRRQLLPLAEHVLCVSGRLSFELVQKAAVAGCPVLVAVGAPSSLAVELAGDRGITLCGFARGGSVNVYTEPWRILG
jgi:FdhD protein